MTYHMVPINLDTDRPLKECPVQEVSDAMNAEIKNFESWFTGQGNAPMVAAERTILKTYLAWKLLHEEGCPASKA